MAEENSYLKKRIKNIEKNIKSEDRSGKFADSGNSALQDSEFWGKKIVIKVPPLNIGNDDNFTVTSATFKRPVSQAQMSYRSSSRRSLKLKEKALIRFALLFNL